MRVALAVLFVLALALALLLLILVDRGPGTGPERPEEAPPVEAPEPPLPPPPEAPPAVEPPEPDAPAPESGVAIRGLVTDGAGNPLEGAMLGTSAGTHGNSDAAGRFEVCVPESGEVELSVKHYAHLNTTLTVRAPAEDVRVVLERGLEISGRVSFPDGKPVPGATLQVSRTWALAAAGEDGRYVLAGLEAGDVEVWCVTSGEKRTIPTGSTDADFVMKSHVAVIRFVDEEGSPVAGATVWVRGIRDGEEVFSSAGTCGAEGIYRVSRVPAGTELQISPSAKGREETVTSLTIDGEPRLHEVVVEMSARREPGTLDLRVLDDGGQPRRKVVLSLRNEAGSPVSDFYNREVELDEDGRGRVEMPPGRFVLEVGDSAAFVSTSGYALASEHEIVIESGQRLPLETALRSGGRIRVTVRDPDGEIVAPVRLDLLDETGERIPARFIRVTDGGWTTSLDEPAPALLGRPVPAGRYRVRVRPEEGVTEDRQADVASGETVEVEVLLPRK